MVDKHDFMLEEYKQVRAELMESARVVDYLVTIGITAIATLTSAFFAVYLSKDCSFANNVFSRYPLLLLTPLTISIPLFFVIIKHRQALFRAGAYIQVYFDEKGTGVAWQTRIGNFRKIMPGNPMDAYLIIFWSYVLISGYLYLWFSMLSRAHIYCIYTVSDILTVISIIMIQACAHKMYKDTSGSYRKNCIDKWREVRESEGKPINV